MATKRYRTRTSGSMEQGSLRGWNTAFNGSILVDNTSYPEELQVGETQKMTDVVTPNFRKRILAGEIVNNHMSQEIVTRDYVSSPTRVRKLSGSGTTIRYYDSTGFAIPKIDAILPTPLTSSVFNPVLEAGTNAWAGVLKPYAELQVERAELRKTLETFRIKTGYLNRHLDSLLKFATRKGKLAKGVNLFATNWLKYRYGIMPLVKSIDSVLENFGRIRARRETSRGKAETSAYIGDLTNVSSSFFSVDYAISKERRTKVRCTILYQINEGWDEYGTDLTNLPGTAWELVPYSFVVDWFANVGSYIRAIQPHLGVEYLDGCTVVEDTVVSKVQAISQSYIGGALYTPELSPSLSDGYTRTVVRRNRSTGLPPKGFALRSHSIAAIPTDKRIIDLFALTANLFRKGNR